MSKTNSWLKSECRLCNEKDCDNCALLPDEEIKLRDYIKRLEHPLYKNNDFIFLHKLPKVFSENAPKSLLWDACANDSGEDEEEPKNNYDSGI